jgi:hypothetical protein
VDVRVIAATDKDVGEAITSGEFPEDLSLRKLLCPDSPFASILADPQNDYLTQFIDGIQ